MKLTQEQYEKISKYLPKQRGNVRISNLQFLNAILYIAENGCKWRVLPKEYGNWHTTELQAEGNINVDVVCLDSTTVKVHPDACGALKKEENNQSAGREADLLQKSIQLLRQRNLQ